MIIKVMNDSFVFEILLVLEQQANKCTTVIVVVEFPFNL